MAKVLIVEDDQSLVDMLRDQLSAEHHVVESASDGQTALQLMKTYQYDVVVLDLMLPELDGIDVCRKYRQSGGNARILMLTGRTKLEEKELGFEAGADDYLTKPFHIRELVARVRAMMRRSADTVTDQLRCGTLTIEPRLFRATMDGVEIHFTPREFAILEFLVRHPNQVFHPNLLLDSVWPSDTEASAANVKAYVHRIRDKLSCGSGGPTIVTVHGLGYKLEAPEKASKDEKRT